MKNEEMFIATPEAEAQKRMLEEHPLEVIRAAAEGIGLILNNPKPNCKKCHGRGFLGRNHETREPIPCSCLFPKYESQREVGDVILPQNREQRRAAKKNK